MSIGATLSAARTAAHLSLEDVAERTRIRRTVIERMEADDFSLAGGEVYARGHIRTIARVVGTDPEPLVAEFDREHASHEPSASQVFESETAARPERRGPNWTAAMVAALVVVVGIGAFQLLRGVGSTGAPVSGPTTSSSALTSPDPSLTSAPPTTAPSVSPTETAVAQVPAGGVTVRVTVATGRSWVAATTGSSTLFQGILDAGQVKVFKDPKQVRLVLGNAGAVRLTVNGKDLGAPGGSGQVARVSFGPGDPTAAG